MPMAMAASRKGRRKSLKNCFFGGCFGTSNKVSAEQGDGKSVKDHKIPMVKSTKEILVIKNDEKETKILAPPEDDELISNKRHKISREKKKSKSMLRAGAGAGQIKGVEKLPPPYQRSDEIEPIVGAIILMVTLMVMLIWGKMCAILTTAAWFYFLPRFTHRPIKLKTAHLLDLDSWEYKKNVVLRGLLHRN
ncbi:hypothetical protein ACS0TY_010683 [Phlomoides rotata]